jgi:hypothetical protein
VLQRRVRKVRSVIARRLNGASRKSATPAPSIARANGHAKDRIVLLVRDPYWLHACWDVSVASVQRAEAALREDWHAAKPILRLFDVSSEDTTSSCERPVRDIEIHGNVNNWYIDVSDPPKSYRVDIGYLSRRGKFFAIAHSNVVSTAESERNAVDENWGSIEEQFERICALAKADDAAAGAELRDVFEDRLRRSMNTGPLSSFVWGAMAANKKRGFWFSLDSELIVHGTAPPASRISLQGERVKLRDDGTFTMRFRLPDKRLIIPVTAASPDGSEERTIVLAVERNTKELEPQAHENGD